MLAKSTILHYAQTRTLRTTGQTARVGSGRRGGAACSASKPSLSGAAAERSGNCLLKLAIRDEQPAFGGRVIVTLAKRDQTQSLPWNRLGVGTPVLLTEEGVIWTARLARRRLPSRSNIARRGPRRLSRARARAADVSSRCSQRRNRPPANGRGALTGPHCRARPPAAASRRALGQSPAKVRRAQAHNAARHGPERLAAAKRSSSPWPPPTWPSFTARPAPAKRRRSSS